MGGSIHRGYRDLGFLPEHGPNPEYNVPMDIPSKPARRYILDLRCERILRRAGVGNDPKLPESQEADRTIAAFFSSHLGKHSVGNLDADEEMRIEPILGKRTSASTRRTAAFLGTASLTLFSVAAPSFSWAQPPGPTPATAACAVGGAGLERAKALIRQGKVREAETAVRRELDAGNDSESGHALLGLILYQEGRWADSLAEFTSAAKFDTPSPSALIVVGLDYVMLRDLGNADRWMTIAAQREPQNGAAWRYLGGIKYSENRFAEAIAAYDKSLALHPRDVLVEDGIGRSLEGLSRDQDAAAAYRTALEWQSASGVKSSQPLLHLGVLLAREGQSQSTLPLLESAEALAPADSEIDEQLGAVYLQMGRLKEAQAEVEKASKLSPNNSHLHWLLASIYRREGRTEDAKRELREYSALLGSHSSDKLR